jgi:hypothetical protein
MVPVCPSHHGVKKKDSTPPSGDSWSKSFSMDRWWTTTIDCFEKKVPLVATVATKAQIQCHRFLTCFIMSLLNNSVLSSGILRAVQQGWFVGVSSSNSSPRKTKSSGPKSLLPSWGNCTRRCLAQSHPRQNIRKITGSFLGSRPTPFVYGHPYKKMGIQT